MCHLVYIEFHVAHMIGREVMPATGYVRVSTVDQAEEGISIEAQEERIRAWCLSSDVELKSVFIDRGLSGKRADNREGLQTALDEVQRERGVLVVYSLSRLARSTSDTLTISERLDRSGCDLVSLSEKIDTTSAAGKMLFRMLAVLNEFERDIISERTREAMNFKRTRGERVGTVPYGFDVSPDGVSLSTNKQEQEVIQLIGNWHSSGKSLRAIAQELNIRDIPTKQRRGNWNHSSVSTIVKR